MYLPFPRCRGRGLVSKGCNSFRPAIVSASLREVRARAPSSPSAPIGKWISRREGKEEWGEDAGKLVDEFEQLLMQAVEERLRADVPVGSYLSGGVDSSMILALACRLKGPAINTYTVRVDKNRSLTN